MYNLRSLKIPLAQIIRDVKSYVPRQLALFACSCQALPLLLEHLHHRRFHYQAPTSESKKLLLQRKSSKSRNRGPLHNMVQNRNLIGTLVSVLSLGSDATTELKELLTAHPDEGTWGRPYNNWLEKSRGGFTSELTFVRVNWCEAIQNGAEAAVVVTNPINPIQHQTSTLSILTNEPSPSFLRVPHRPVTAPPPEPEP